MGAVRTFRSRPVRLHLSTRYQCLRRKQSTIPEANRAASSSPSARPSFLRRNRSPIIWSALGLALGLMGGNMVLHTIAPPALPGPGTREDRVLVDDLNRWIDNEFKVKVLRGKCLGVAKQLKGTEGGWVEILPPAEETAPGADGLNEHIQGARGLGVERLFWDRGEQKLVAVVWFGPSLAGWPGITHGGMLATVLSEKLALAAMLAENTGGHVSEAAIPQRMPGTGNHAKMFAPTTKPAEPAQLRISYFKPTYANNFYVIRVTPSEMPLAQDSEETTGSRGGHEYEATLETLDAKVSAKATARFASSNTLERPEEKVKGIAKSGYEEFKEWMWPSRQKSSQI